MSIFVKILLQNRKVDIARSIYVRQNLQNHVKDKRLKNCENQEFNYFSNMIFDKDYFNPTQENIQLAQYNSFIQMGDFKQSIEHVVILDQNVQSATFQQFLMNIEAARLVGVSYQMLSGNRYHDKGKNSLLSLIQFSTQKRHYLIDCLSISTKEIDQIYE